MSSRTVSPVERRVAAVADAVPGVLVLRTVGEVFHSVVPRVVVEVADDSAGWTRTYECSGDKRVNGVVPAYAVATEVHHRPPLRIRAQFQDLAAQVLPRPVGLGDDTIDAPNAPDVTGLVVAVPAGDGFPDLGLFGAGAGAGHVRSP